MTDFATLLAWVAQDLEERHGYQYAGAVRQAARRLSELEAMRRARTRVSVAARG